MNARFAWMAHLQTTQWLGLSQWLRLFIYIYSINNRIIANPSWVSLGPHLASPLNIVAKPHVRNASKDRRHEFARMELMRWVLVEVRCNFLPTLQGILDPLLLQQILEVCPCSWWEQFVKRSPRSLHGNVCQECLILFNLEIWKAWCGQVRQRLNL